MSEDPKERYAQQKAQLQVAKSEHESLLSAQRDLRRVSFPHGWSDLQGKLSELSASTADAITVAYTTRLRLELDVARYESQFPLVNCTLCHGEGRLFTLSINANDRDNGLRSCEGCNGVGKKRDIK